jgi:soluble lytic murein transglycosylase-like protein
MPWSIRVCLGVAALALVSASPAAAEIAVLGSGQTLSIKSHRLIDGDLIVLQLRSGGEVTCDKSLVEKILPDEVPYQEPQQTPEPDAAPLVEEAVGPVEMGPYGEIILSVAETHGVDPLLVRALIQVESGDRSRARSRKGAMGLMQLMPATARQYNLRNPYDPKANIAAGVKHLKSLLDRMGGAVDLALAAYNAGEGAVKKFNGIPPYRETRDYVRRILSLASPAAR